MYVRNKILLKIVGVGIIGLILGTARLAEAQQATLVNTINTTTFGSSDPSGLTFFPANASIWLADSEVEETSFFTGFNLFELTGSGAVLRTYSTLGFSKEPTGVTFNAATGTLLISDDDKKRVFEVNPLDPETALSSFSTLAFGSTDPSDITFDPTTGNLFISDGFDSTVFEVTPSGTLLRSFLLPGVIRDAEGIFFDRCSGNLFIVSGPDKKIFEVTTSGEFVTIIDIQAFGVLHPKGITFAPSSDLGDDPNILHVYIADYGRDEVNDGKLLEILLAGNSGCTGTPPQITSGPTATPNVIFADQAAQLSVTASDVDGDPLTYNWTVMPGGGTITGTGDTVTYTPPAAITGQQTFTVTVKVRDGNGGSDTGTVGVTVIPVGGGLTFTPVADTFVNSNSPTTNYGSATTLQVDGSPTKITYLRFNVTGLSGAVQSARLRLEVVDASTFGGTLYSMSDISWGETTVTYNTRPVIDGLTLGKLGAVALGAIVEFDVTAAISGNGTYSFAINSTNSDAVFYRSREAGINPPALVITTAGGPANTPPQISSGPTAAPNPVDENQTAQLSVTASDADGDPLTYTWTAPPGGGTISGTGATVTYTPPDVSVQQTFTITVTVSDGQGGTATGTVGVTVQPVAPGNTPPTANNLTIAGTAQVGQLLTGNYTYADADGDLEGTSTYRWLRNGASISGATAKTYTLVAADQGALIVFEVTPVAATGASPGAPVQSPAVGPVSAGGGGTQLTFTPVADTFVNSNSPNTNYGSRTTLEVDGSPIKIAYLRFSVTGLSGAVQSARLRLEVVDASSFGGTIYSISNNTWGERTVTYNTRPVIDGPALAALGKVAVGNIVELDVTAAIFGNGTYSFAMDSNNSNGADYRSREAGTNPPLLIITTN